MPKLAAERFSNQHLQSRQLKRETVKERSIRARAIATRLATMYPEIECPLIHSNSFELLLAVILSAQCTDAAVNKVTPELFRRYPTPAALSVTPLPEIEGLLRPLGLFRTKAKSLKRSAEQLVREFDGKVPARIDELISLPGVGRKTANVILGHAFGIPGIAVDTHCKRVARRLGLSQHQVPNRIESDLTHLLPPREWMGFSHRLIIHGRRICHACKPACPRCEINPLCPSRFIAKS